MSNVVSLPQLDYYHEQLLRYQQKRDKIIMQRDRLNQRIHYLNKAIEMYEHEIKPEVKEKRRKFWDDIRNKP